MDSSATALRLLRWCAHRNEGLGSLPDPAQLDRLRLQRIDSLAYMAAGVMSDPHQRLYAKLWNAQRSVLEKVTHALSERGVPVIVFKGSEFISRCFDSQPIGMLYDVDILIPRAHIEEAKSAVHGIGLRQTVWDARRRQLVHRDVADIARLETAHYELAPFGVELSLDTDEEESEIVAKWDQHPLYRVGHETRCAVEVDIHHQVASDIESAPLFARAVESVIPNARSLSPADLVWFTTSRFYTEAALHSKRSLRDFAYLAAFLARTQVDWGTVLGASREYALHSSLFYYLSFLKRVAHVDVPDDVLAQLNPMHGTRHRDWGWQLGPVFGFVEPFPIQEL